MIDSHLLATLKGMAHSPIVNYGIPGLTSYLVGPAPDPKKKNSGCVRLFHSARQHVEPITPHSHRFAFHAIVLRGRVINRLWKEDPAGDEYQFDCLTYKGKPGCYKRERIDTRRYTFEDHHFEQGQSYGMSAEEIHSIYFDRDTWVLMLEQPSAWDMSHILVPEVDAQVIDTFKVEPWMFLRP